MMTDIDEGDVGSAAKGNNQLGTFSNAFRQNAQRPGFNARVDAVFALSQQLPSLAS
jgi:hypothetical protein